MVKRFYIPKQGDVVWLNFRTGTGHEQFGKRPAIVVSPEIYNGRSGLALVCPITSREKGYPFESPLSSKRIKGVVLADQLRSVDWAERKIKFIFKVSPEVFRDIQDKILLLIK